MLRQFHCDKKMLVEHKKKRLCISREKHVQNEDICSITHFKMNGGHIQNRYIDFLNEGTLNDRQFR